MVVDSVAAQLEQVGQMPSREIMWVVHGLMISPKQQDVELQRISSILCKHVHIPDILRRDEHCLTTLCLAQVCQHISESNVLPT